jgi:hypothetical protein
LPIDPVIAYLSKDTQAAFEAPPKAFEEVRDIHESDYKGPVSAIQKVSLIEGVLVMPPPTQKFMGTIETAEGMYAGLPPRPVPAELMQSRLEGKRNREYEALRLKYAQSGAKLAPQLTYEERVAAAGQEVSGHLRLISELQSEIEEKDREIEEMQEVLQREERGKAAQLALGRIKAAEDKIKAMEDEALDDDERTALIIARNKELYAEIDLALSKARTPSPTYIPPTAPQIAVKPLGKGKKPGSLRPQVLKKPLGSQMLTRRISSAFGTAERAIKVATTTRKLVPAVLSRRK